jgi:CRISPR-associated protein Csm3
MGSHVLPGSGELKNMTLRVSKYGYAYVDLPDEREIAKRKRPLISHAEYDPDRLSGEIVCLLTAIIPVHIGSGIYELAEDVGITGFSGVVKGTVKEGGLSIIPGSSLKGVFRSITEAISYSCVLGYHSCEAKSEDSELCIACGLFGAMGFMGRVSFSKATIVNESDYRTRKQSRQPPKSVEMWGPSRPRQGRRFYPHIDYLSDAFWNSENKGEFDITVIRDRRGNAVGRYSSRQEFIEAKVVEPYDFIPEGTELLFKVRFENLEKKEIGLVLSGMGVGSDNQPIFQPRLGGSKPFCFGAIEVRVKGANVFYQENANTFTTFERGNQSVPEDIQDWVRENIKAFLETSSDGAEGLLFGQGFEQIKQILHFPTQLPVTVI